MSIYFYRRNVNLCINEKLIDFAMESAKSLYNIEIFYHYQIEEIARLFNNPVEHYTKIQALAYRRTIKEFLK